MFPCYMYQRTQLSCKGCRADCACAAAYYTSFASVGIVIYFLRVKKGYRSLPEAINARYGPLASVAFGNSPTPHSLTCLSP